MPQFKRVGDARVAYGALKFTSYSRAITAKAKRHLTPYVLESYKDLLEQYEAIGQGMEGGTGLDVTDFELDELMKLEGLARALLTDEDYGAITDKQILSDLLPNRASLINLWRTQENKPPILEDEDYSSPWKE